MKTYTLKLKTTSTTNYNLYDGTTLVSDTDLGTLFGSAGEAYFVFDFDSLTPTDTTSLTILNSQDTAVITNTGLSGIAEDKNFKGTWEASATAFTSFTLLGGVAMDEAQISKLVGVAKDGKIKTLTTADYNYPESGTKTGIAFWLLTPGVYLLSSGITYYRNGIGGTYSVTVNGTIAIVGARNSANTTRVLTHTEEAGWQAFASAYATSATVKTFAPINYLTSTDAHAPLSANQGKVLNERIGDLSTLTTTAQTSAVAAINEIVSEIGDVESALQAINNGGNA